MQFIMGNNSSTQDKVGAEILATVATYDAPKTSGGGSNTRGF